MKKQVLILSLFIVTQGYAQTRSGEYKRIETTHYEAKTGNLKSKLIALKPGFIEVGNKLVTVDLKGAESQRQVFTIVKRSEVQDYCYDDDPGHYGIQFLQTFYPYKDNELKFCRIVLLFAKDKKTITDVIVQKSKSTEICYSFQ